MTLPKRYNRYGVGKHIGASVYVHRAHEKVLPDSFNQAKEIVPPRLSGEEYTLIKYNMKKGSFTFIWCNDFDTADEPTMGMAILCSPNPNKYNGFETRIIWPPTNPWIYHHKWLMVGDNYDGFSVEKSKARSRAWLSLKNIDKCRIGQKTYWEKNVIPLISKI